MSVVKIERSAGERLLSDVQEWVEEWLRNIDTMFGEEDPTTRGDQAEAEVVEFDEEDLERFIVEFLYNAIDFAQEDGIPPFSIAWYERLYSNMTIAVKALFWRSVDRISDDLAQGVRADLVSLVDRMADAIAELLEELAEDEPIVEVEDTDE